MTTKQFEFPTFAQWATESYRRMVDKDLFGPTSMGRIEENIAEEFFKEWRRFYALDFLSSLAKFVNEGRPAPISNYYYPVWFAEGGWTIAYAETQRAVESTLRVVTYDGVKKFSNYEGCGTTAKEQLNILYNIDQ